MALDAVRSAWRRVVGAVAVGVHSVAGVGFNTAAEVACVAGGAPRRDVGDKARRVCVFGLPVVPGRVDLGGCVWNCHLDRRPGVLWNRPQNPVVPVSVRVVARATTQWDHLAVVRCGASRAVAPRHLIGRVG